MSEGRARREGQARANKKEIRERDQEQGRGITTITTIITKAERKGSSELPIFSVPQLCAINRYEFMYEEGKSTKLNKAGLVE
eukprot:3181891-Ditylum_brightwellii.AAC.1